MQQNITTNAEFNEHSYATYRNGITHLELKIPYKNIGGKSFGE